MIANNDNDKFHGNKPINFKSHVIKYKKESTLLVLIGMLFMFSLIQLTKESPPTVNVYETTEAICKEEMDYVKGLNYQSSPKFEQKNKLTTISNENFNRLQLKNDNLYLNMMNTITVQDDILFRRQYKKARGNLIIVSTYVNQLDIQFLICIHSRRVDIFASPELLNQGATHADLTTRISKEVKRLKKLKKRPLKFFDIGGNIGYMSLIFASLDNEGSIVAVEPTNFHRSLFELSISLNPQLSNRIKIFPNAIVSDITKSPKELCFEMPDERNAGFTKVLLSNSCPINMKAETTTLDILAKKTFIPDIIKIDVEGFENEALLGAQEIFSSNLPSVVIYEYNSITSSDNTIEMADKLVDFFFIKHSGWIMEDSHQFKNPKQYTTAKDAIEYLTSQTYWVTDLIFVRA